MDFSYSLMQAMADYQLHTNSINLDIGKYHRFRSLGTCKAKCCEYRIFENYLGAHFKCFRRGIDRIWFANSDHKPTAEERYMMQEERTRIWQARRLSYSKAAKRCHSFYHKLKPAHYHPYLVRKQIDNYAARTARSMLVIPITDVDCNVQSLQFIKRNGFKQFKTGATTKGGMIWLWDSMLEPEYDGVIRVCEGWSTGCTIRRLTQSPVVCALNAYNLVSVCIELRRKYVHARLKICADNDQWGSDDNVGINNAADAAHMTGATLHYPNFAGLPTQHCPTDFNDLHLLVGDYLTKRQLVVIREL